MLKSFQSGKRTSSKGQWFFISAVIASGIFLSISVIFKDYFAVDSSAALSDEDFYFSSDTNSQWLTIEDLRKMLIR